MKKLPISVCIISGAEAHRIERALKSVASWTSEIIVVLNEEVADGTEQLATQYGAKVFRERWKGFIGQKNSALDKASQPWLFNLDADEVVAPALVEEISRVLLSPGPTESAYEIPRCTCYGGRWIRHGDWYPDHVCRLWRRGCARWTGQEPHARLQVDGRTGRLHADLLHYSMEDLNHLVRKALDYSNDFLRQQLAAGRTVSSLDVLARPVWRFVRCYFLRLGFLDGWQGYHVAWMGAFYTFLRYARVLEEQRKGALLK